MLLLGLGSNLISNFGARFLNIELAIHYLEENKIKVVKKSSFYETPSYPNIKKPKFINLVIQVKTSLTPKMLALTIFKIEETMRKVFKLSLKVLSAIVFLKTNNTENA